MTKKILYASAISLFFLLSSSAGFAGPDEVKVVFNKHCDDLLIKEIKSAKKEILIAIYTITNAKIVDAIIEASEDDVRIHVRYDKIQAKEARSMDKDVERLKDAGIECEGIEIKSKYGRMHHKYTVIDRRIVLTGSFNYTVTASTVNRENAVQGIFSPRPSA